MRNPVTIYLIIVVAFMPFSVFADTAFTNSAMESADHGARQLTIRTGDGRSWLLPVESEELLKGIQKGDRVSLKIGPDDRVKKIVKSQSHGSQRPTRQDPSE